MKRDSVKECFKWKLEDIISSDDEWSQKYNEIRKKLGDVQEFRGKLSDEKELLSALKKDEEISKELLNLYAYAKMKHDENTANSKYITMGGKAESIFSEYSQFVSYMIPELTKETDEKLTELKNKKEFSEYSYMLEKIIKDKKHVLSEQEEKLISAFSEVTGFFSDVFEMLDNADLNLPTVEIDGKEEQLTHGNYSLFMQNDDREVRKAVFEKYYISYKKIINTIATTYNANVKKDWVFAKTRGYKSCLEKALNIEDVDKNVYENLIESVHTGLPVLHDYIELKKNTLKLKEFKMYDMYYPIVSGSELKLPYEKAYDVVVEGLSVLGEEYSTLLKTAYSDRWIDVYETENKRSGAYSFGVYGVHPYVLLNYHQTTNNIFTIAHEMGHAMHSYYSNKTQPFAKADYVIFVAEVASTVNEILLLKHLIKTTSDKNLKKYLLYYLLEMFRTTMFRQTQFAEFEVFSHKLVEDGEVLTVDNLSEEYEKLNKEYYGKALSEDEFIKYEWARIPHFYRAFYVYKYATGIISAVSITDKILSGEKDAVKNYIDFLSSGGKTNPVDLLKIAGVDLNQKEPFERAMKVFKETLEELKKTL